MPPIYKELPFAGAEFDARLAGLRGKMAARGLDALVLSAPENLYYLTGYDTTGFHSFFQAMVIAGEGDPAILTRYLEVINFEGTAHRTRGVGYQDHEEPAAALAALLDGMGLAQSCIGFEKLVPWLTVGVYEAAATALPGARIEDASGLVEELRSIKSPNSFRVPYPTKSRRWRLDSVCRWNLRVVSQPSDISNVFATSAQTSSACPLPSISTIRSFAR